MSYRMSCRRSIPAFTLTLLLILPAAGAAAAGRDRQPAERGQIAVVLESLWQWLGLAPAPPAALGAPNGTEGDPATGSGPGPGTGGETQGGTDPTGTGPPPPEYHPDLNPGGAGGG